MIATPVSISPALLDRLRPIRAGQRHAFTPVQVDVLMQDIYARGDRLMLGFLAGHVVLSLALAFYHQTWLPTLLVSAVTLGGFALLVRLYPRTFFTRSMASVAQQAFVALHIYQMDGMAEQHFWFFTAFTMLIVYQDWLCMWPGTVLIILQHTVFAWLHNSGHAVHFFPEASVGFTKLFFHFGIALVQVALCGYWAHLLKRQTLEDAWQRMQLGRSGEQLEEQLIRVRASEAALQGAADALRDSEGRQRAILDNIPDMAWVKDTAGRYVAVNDALAALLGRPAAEIAGLHDVDIFPPEVAREHVAEDQRLLAAGRALRVEQEVTNRAGLRMLLETIRTPIMDATGRAVGTTGIARDIGERREAEEERRRLEAKMLHAQKLESLGVLAGGLAHDFNNLLVGILGNVSLARSELDLNTTGRETLERIEASAIRAADLTRQMLAYSGKGRFVLERLDLSRTVQEMTQLLSTVVSKKATIRLDLASNLPGVEADATQIRQVVMNLITNASDALGDEVGVITIVTARQEADQDYLAAIEAGPELQPGTYVSLDVSDTGVGMDAATIQRVFDPFFTTKFTGRGLGLAAVQGIMRGHGGAIKVYSEPGRGTTFKVLFPAVDPAPVPGRVPVAGGIGAAVGGTVLVVDDESLVRDVARRVLQRAGYTVLVASDGEEALVILRQQHASIDCVLLDMMMPRLSGEETFREIRRFAPTLPVVLSSGYNEQDATSHFVGRGLAGFVQKPYRGEELVQALQAAIASRPPA